MKVSIITATYNSERTLTKTIESVLTQSHDDIEYIIVDGASKDGTLDIIKSYVPRFNGRLQYISERDNGIYDAMNKGYKRATGDVIAIINSDDFFCDERAIEKVVKTFEENPQTDGVYANLYYIGKNDDDKIVRKWVTGEQGSFMKGWLPAHPTFYVKRAIYEKYGYFNLDYKLAADFELMLRFTERYHIRLTYLPEFLVKMRLGGATSKSIGNIIKQDKECIRAFKDNGISASPLYLFYRFLPKIKQYIR